jgi:hypothetical protein
MGKPFRFSAGISKVAPGGPEYPLGGSEDAVRPDGLSSPATARNPAPTGAVSNIPPFDIPPSRAKKILFFLYPCRSKKIPGVDLPEFYLRPRRSRDFPAAAVRSRGIPD